MATATNNGCGMVLLLTIGVYQPNLAVEKSWCTQRWCSTVQ